MRMDVVLHLDIESASAALTKALAPLIAGVTRMAGELDDLKAQVAQNSSLAQSAITLIQGLADRIEQAGVDPAALAAITADLRAQDEALAAAISANTPAQPPSP